MIDDEIEVWIIILDVVLQIVDEVDEAHIIVYDEIDDDD